MMQKKIRFGICGFGLFAERAIAPAIQASPFAELIAVQKRSLRQAQEKADLFQLPYAFDTIEKMVACRDIDAVFIVSANSEHCHETIAAAEAGKHVLVEKPMAMNAAEAQKMIDVCADKKVKLMVGHMVRLSPAIVRMKQLLKLGGIGQLRFVRSEFVYDARASKRQWLFDRTIAGGGPIFDIGVHCLDTIRFILDEEVADVSGVLSPSPTFERTESTALLSLKFSQGTIASIHCSFEAPYRRSYLELIGDRGVLSLENFTLSKTQVVLQLRHWSNGEQESSRPEEIEIPDLYQFEVSEFSRSILENRPAPIPPTDTLQNQVVIDKMMTL